MKQRSFKPGHLKTGSPILKQTDASRAAMSKRGRTHWTIYELKKNEVALNWTKGKP